MSHRRTDTPSGLPLACLLIGALTLAGCTPESGLTSAPDLSSRGGVPGQPTTVHETDRVELPLPVAWPRLLALHEKRAAFVTDDDAGHSTIFLADLTTKSVADVEADGWQVQQIQMDSEHLVRVEQDRQQTDALEPVQWRIVVRDLRTNRQSTPFESERPTPLAPGIMLADGFLFHDTWHGFERGTSSLFKYDFTSKKDQRVVVDLPFHLTAFDGRHLLGGLTTRGATPAETRSDLYVLDEKPPRRLTTSGQVDGADYVNGVLLWEDCRRAACQVIAQEWPGGTPTELLSADMPMAHLGDGFAVVRSAAGSGPALLPLGAPKESVVLRVPEGETMVGAPEVSQHEVAWVTVNEQHPEQPGHLIVVTVGHGRDGRR